MPFIASVQKVLEHKYCVECGVGYGACRPGVKLKYRIHHHGKLGNHSYLCSVGETELATESTNRELGQYSGQAIVC